MQSAPAVAPEALALLSKLRKTVVSHSFTESQVRRTTTDLALAMARMDVAGTLCAMLNRILSRCTRTQILDAYYRYPDVVSWLYEQFSARHKPASTAAASSEGRSSPQPLPLDHAAVLAHLRRVVKSSEEDVAIFAMMATFNAAVLRTNFYRRNVGCAERWA
jgi:NAD-specific glutamate dehydrogenase